MSEREREKSKCDLCCGICFFSQTEWISKLKDLVSAHTEGMAICIVHLRTRKNVKEKLGKIIIGKKICIKGNLAVSIAHTVRTHYYRVFDVLK